MFLYWASHSLKKDQVLSKVSRSVFHINGEQWISNKIEEHSKMLLNDTQGLIHMVMYTVREIFIGTCIDLYNT